MLRSMNFILAVVTIVLVSAEDQAFGLTSKWHHVQGGVIRDVAFGADGVHGCTAEDGARIRFTVNSGSSWDYASVPDGVRVELFAVSFLKGSSSDCYACGDGGVVLQSTDGGATWSDKNASSRILDALGHPAKLQAIQMFSASSTTAEGWVVGYDGAIAHTIHIGAITSGRTPTTPAT